MKVEELCETPQYTFPQEFGLDDINSNRSQTRELLKKPKTPLRSIGDYTLYEFSRAFALIKNEPAEIAYIVRFQHSFVKLLGRSCVSQILVWRNNLVPETRDLATEIFFGHLLPNTKTIITDSYQTDDGKRFWENRIQDAFRLGLHVYYASLVPNREIVKISSIKEFMDLKNDKNIWGDHQVNQAKKVIITSQPF